MSIFLCIKFRECQLKPFTATKSYPELRLLYIERLIVGSWMVFSLGNGYLLVRQHRFAEHGKWMIRAYAIGMGAGTQVFTHIPYEIFFGKPTEGPRAFLMGAGWVINFLIAEWIISKRLTRPTRTARRANFSQI